MRVIINVKGKLRATLSLKGSALASSDTDGPKGLFPFLSKDRILVPLKFHTQTHTHTNKNGSKPYI